MQIHIIASRLLFLLLMSIIGSGASTWKEKVQNFDVVLSRMSSKRGSGKESMQFFSDNNNDFLAATNEAFELTRKGLTIDYEAFSDEKTSLDDLKDILQEFSQIFDVAMTESQISLQDYEIDFVQSTTDSIRKVWRELINVCHRNFKTRSVSSTEFKLLCKSPSVSPDAILREIRNLFHKNCAFSTKESMRDYINLLSTIEEFEEGLSDDARKVIPSVEYKSAKRELLKSNNATNNAAMTAKIRDESRLRFNYGQQVLDFLKAVTVPLTNSERCIMRANANGSIRSRDIMYSFLEYLRTVVLQTEILQVACRKFSSTMDDFSDVHNAVADTVMHSANWIQEDFDLAYPDLQLHFANRLLASSPLISHTRYNETARLIRQVFRDTSDDRTDYSTIVSLHDEGGDAVQKSVVYNKSVDTFVSFLDVSWANIYVFKLQYPDKLELDEKYEYFDKRKERMTETMRTIISEPDPEVMMNLLQASYQLVKPQRYQNLFVLRKESSHDSLRRLILGFDFPISINGYIVKMINVTDNVYNNWFLVAFP